MNHELQAERTHNQSGFTLIELLVSISIIAILASVGMVVYSSTQKTARLSKRAEDLKAIQATLELYKTSTGQYPIAVNNFVCIPSILAPTYMPKIPTDPSDSTLCYQYQSDASGIEYKVASNPTLVTSGEMKQSDFLSRPTLVDPARDADASANCSLNTSGTVSGWAYYSGQTACTYVTSGGAPPPPPPPPPAGPSLVGPTGTVNKGTSVNVSWNDVA
ncbi:MAG: Tfp pilus assembly protein PilE-like protein, partial [Candidatus Daviesbacteria bacterium GW2011_GWA1_36_8]